MFSEASSADEGRHGFCLWNVTADHEWKGTQRMGGNGGAEGHTTQGWEWGRGRAYNAGVEAGAHHNSTPISMVTHLPQYILLHVTSVARKERVFL